MPLFGKKEKTPNLPPHPEITRQRNVSSPDIWVYFATWVNNDMELQMQIDATDPGWEAEPVPWSMWAPDVQPAVWKEHGRNHKWLFSIGTASGGRWGKWELPCDPPPVPGEV
jgi:hypothetical protein